MQISDILMGRIAYDQLPADQKASIKALYSALHDLETAYLAAGGKAFKVSSGYRSPAQNAAAGGVKLSAHMTCQACDIVDTDGLLKGWVLKHVPLLEKLGLYMEHQDSTPTWLHVQIRPTKNRVFKP